MVDHFRDAYFNELGIDRIMVYSEMMRNVMKQVDRLSLSTDINVLIQGESGTGKDLIASYIHYMSKDARKRPFIAINCAAIPRDLVESELFGYEAGAFTDSKKEGNEGKIELASNGTIFLDEIGDMPLDIQSKFLRVVEDRRFYKVGGSEEKPVKARFIFATNKELQDEVEKGNFRLDLYYRINVGNIKIPPLRDRKMDIIPMAKYFARRYFPRSGNSFFGFTESAENLLTSHKWPGNVRELKNLMERLSFTVFGEKINKEELLSIIEATGNLSRDNSKNTEELNLESFELPDRPINIDDFNKELIKKALAKCEGNKTEASKYLGISRRKLYSRLKKYSLQ